MPIRSEVSWVGLIGLFLSSRLLAQSPATDAIDFDSLRQEAAVRLSEYLRINTSNPPGNELASARWLKEVLAREGVEGQILDTTELGPGRANFYARLKGSGKGKAIALVHHMDVVPADPKFWKEDPFGGAVKDGAVWGRGALDMKGQGIIQLMAFIALKRAGVPLTRDVVLIANADEEATSLGAQVFIQRHRDLIRDVGFLLTESDQTRVEQGKVRWFGIDVGEKRSYWQRLTVRGVGSHGSQPTPYNPVPRLARIIARIAAWETPLHLTPAVERYFKAQAQERTGRARIWLADPAAALRTREGRAWLLSEPERNALLRNTISPTVLVGSDKINSIPSQPQSISTSVCFRTRIPRRSGRSCYGSSPTPVPDSPSSRVACRPSIARRSTPKWCGRSSERLVACCRALPSRRRSIPAAPIDRTMRTRASPATAWRRIWSTMPNRTESITG